MLRNQPCLDCGRVLPLDTEHFGPHPTMATGLRNRCRECVRIAARKDYADHAEQRRAQAKRRREERAEMFRAMGVWDAA